MALENETIALWWKALCGVASLTDCDALAEECDRYGQVILYRTMTAARLLCLQAADTCRDGARVEIAHCLDFSRGVRGCRELITDLVHSLRRADGEGCAEIRSEWIDADRGYAE